MPHTYTRRFRVRATDCDAAGHVNHAVYARYMQEAAIEASADAGFDYAWYDAHGANWLIRRSRIDYLQPARYGDELDVTTYVANLRRVRSQRNYQIVRAADGVRLAQAATDWVFVDQRSGAPARIPELFAPAFLPDGSGPDVDLILDSDKLPDAPPPRAFHTARRVNFYDMDENAHVNNAVYLNYLEQAAIDAGASVGFDMPQLLELGGLFVVRQHDIEYLRPARYGDILDVATWIGETSHSSLARHTTMHIRGGELSIRARTLWVWIGLESRRATAIPGALRDAFSRQAVSERAVTTDH